MKQQVPRGAPATSGFDQTAISDSSPISPEMRAFLSNDPDQHLSAIEQLYLRGDIAAAQTVARDALLRLDIHPNVLFVSLAILPAEEVRPAVNYLWMSAEHLRVPLLLSLNNAMANDAAKVGEIVRPLLTQQSLEDPALFHLAAKLGQA